MSSFKGKMSITSNYPLSDAQVCCAQPTQVLVFYSIKELTIENSSNVKVRKGLFAKKAKVKGCP
jgi:hypothetical protein